MDERYVFLKDLLKSLIRLINLPARHHESHGMHFLKGIYEKSLQIDEKAGNVGNLFIPLPSFVLWLISIAQILIREFRVKKIRPAIPIVLYVRNYFFLFQNN